MFNLRELFIIKESLQANKWRLESINTELMDLAEEQEYRADLKSTMHLIRVVDRLIRRYK